MSSHRYWRIYITDTEDELHCQIGNIELRDDVGGTNLVGNGTPIDSGGRDPANAFDGDASTYWDSDPAWSVVTLPAYIGYDFGAGNDVTIVEVAITSYSGGGGGEQAPEDFTIDYSDDGSSWTTAATFTNEPSWGDGVTREYLTGFSPPVIETGVASLTLFHEAEVTGFASLTLAHDLSESGKASLTLEHAVEQTGKASLTLDHVLSAFGNASLTLEYALEPVTGIAGLVVYHQVTETDKSTLTVRHEVVPVTGSPSLTLHHAPVNEGKAALTVDHHVQASTTGNQWQLIVWLDGEDVTDQITGQVRIEANKGAARLADFLFRPDPGVLDPQSYVKKTVEIDYLTYENGVTVTNHRRFTGIVDEATFDPVTRLVSFVCTDNLQGAVEAQDFELIDQWTGGEYSAAIFAETDNGWEYAQQRMASQPASFDRDVYGGLRKWSWFSKSVPDQVISADDIIDGSIGLTQNTSRDIINTVEISFSFGYGRLWQRELRAYWKYGRSFGDYLVLSSELPNREMFISAIDKSWWVKSLAFTPLPASGTYNTTSGPVNWVISDTLRNSLIWAANAVLAKRWVQDVTEKYTVTVSAPASIDRFGEAKQVNRYAWQVPVNESFERVQQTTPALDEYGSLTTSSYQPPPAGASQVGDDYYLDDDRRADFNQAIKTAIAIARTDILRSHHQNEVTVQTLLNPYVDIGNTIEVDTTTIEAVGTLGQIVEVYDIGAGSAWSTLSINVFAPNVAGQTDDAIAVPARPDVEPDEEVIDFNLGTYLGGSDVTTPHDPDWRGFIGNYSGLKTFNAVTYPHEFRLETPAVSDARRDPATYEASSSTVVAIPQETLQITVID